MGVTENDTDLGGSKTLTSILDDLLNDRVGSKLQPARSLARVGSGGRRDSLSFAVKTTHFD